MFMITLKAVLLALLVSPEPAGFVATQQLDWLDDQPMEVPAEYANPGRGGCHIAFGGAFVNDRMQLVPTVAGELRFAARRQIKLSSRVLAREVVRIYVGEGPGCCGGGELVPFQEIASRPFWTGGHVLINDVRPFAFPLPPGEYTVSIAIELFEARDSDTMAWHPGAVKTRRFLVY
jgi:hypothetical protein